VAVASSLALVAVSDDPLSAKGDKHSKWAEWHRDEDLRAEIEKDVSRTSPGLPFFAKPANLAAMSRILFVYAKLNAGVRYVQGMNELLAPLWFVFATERAGGAAIAAGCAAAPSPSRSGSGGGGASTGHAVVSPDDAEADTFFCFMGLMSEVSAYPPTRASFVHCWARSRVAPTLAAPPGRCDPPQTSHAGA